jgi:hypothetical protein
MSHPPTPDLSGIPIAATGSWGAMNGEADALPVMEQMRTAALAEVRLLSDRQPPRIVVEGNPHNPDLPLVDIRPREDGAAWIWLRVDGPVYAKLAYQFGHELGHVLCNRWNGGQANLPATPCQWIEEVLVEAFSLFGLRALAPLWAKQPPREYMNDYHVHLIPYVEETLRAHASHRQARTLPDEVSSWYRVLAGELDQAVNLRVPAPQMIVPFVYDIFVKDPALREDLGALNRWAERSSVPVTRYMELWKQSCREIGSVGRLPDLMVETFGLGRTN